MYFIRNYTMPVSRVFRHTYNYTLNDFYKVSGQVDLLGLTSQQEKINQYIRNHRKKSICIALFGEETVMYKWVKRLFMSKL